MPTPSTSDLAQTQAILGSLIEAPLLLDDLPEAATFPQETLTRLTEFPPLNFAQKLGHLYEDALTQLLNASARYELCARNLQLQSDRHHTVGELDFLLHDQKKDKVIHLELATKFYLAHDSPDGFSLPGPDARDNYFKKLQRLRQHQLVLSTKHRALLPPEFRDAEIETRHLIHGCLFQHIDARTAPQPGFANPACRRGKHLSIDEFSSHFRPETKAEVIPKALWPVPLHLLKNISLQSWARENKLSRCLMLRIADSPEPLFVTPTDWPQSS